MFITCSDSWDPWWKMITDLCFQDHLQMLVRSTSGFMKYLSLVFLKDGWLGRKKFQEHFSINHGEFFSLAIWNAFLYFFKKNNVCINNLVGMGSGPRWDDHGNHYWWFLVAKQSVPPNLEFVIGRWVTAEKPCLSHLHDSPLLHPNCHPFTQFFCLFYLNCKMLISSLTSPTASKQTSIQIDNRVVLQIWVCHCFDQILLGTLYCL